MLRKLFLSLVLGLSLFSINFSAEKLRNQGLNLPKSVRLPDGREVRVPDITTWQLNERHFQVVRNKKVVYVDNLIPGDILLGKFEIYEPSKSSPAWFKFFYPLDHESAVLVQWSEDNKEFFGILFKEDGTIVASTAVLSGMGPNLVDGEWVILAYIDWRGERLAERKFAIPK